MVRQDLLQSLLDFSRVERPRAHRVVRVERAHDGVEQLRVEVG